MNKHPLTITQALHRIKRRATCCFLQRRRFRLRQNGMI
jgi:hypothetical protein